VGSGGSAVRQLAIKLLAHAGAQWLFESIQELPSERGHHLIPVPICLLGRCFPKQGMPLGRHLGKQRLDDDPATFFRGQFRGRGKSTGEI
jgi:hypothetical protein